MAISHRVVLMMSRAIESRVCIGQRTSSSPGFTASIRSPRRIKSVLLSTHTRHQILTYITSWYATHRRLWQLPYHYTRGSCHRSCWDSNHELPVFIHTNTTSPSLSDSSNVAGPAQAALVLVEASIVYTCPRDHADFRPGHICEPIQT